MNSTDELRMQRADAVFALAPVIPVITIDDLEDALPMARALVDNGLKVLEVTLRTPVALDAIERIATEVPDACVGAGTVLDLVGLKASIRAGARFAISPGATEALYAVFTFAWTPLHYLHLMFITLVATILVAVGLSRLMGAPAAVVDAA